MSDEFTPERLAKLKNSYENYLKSTSHSGIIRKIQRMTFDEYLIWNSNRSKKINETIQKTKKINQESRALFQKPSATSLLSTALKTVKRAIDFAEVFAQIQSDDKFVPLAPDLYAFHTFLAGRPIEEVRAKDFNFVPLDVWQRFLRLYFQFFHGNSEQVAMELRKTRSDNIESLREQITMLKSIQDKSEDSKERLEIAKVIGTLNNQLSSVSSQYAKDLTSLGLLGSRIKGGIAIQIINKIPRPPDPKRAGTLKHGISVEAIDTSFKEVTLDE